MMQGVKNKSTPLSVLFPLFALKIALKNTPPN
jgi:hypothetical protein